MDRLFNRKHKKPPVPSQQPVLSGKPAGVANKTSNLQLLPDVDAGGSPIVHGDKEAESQASAPVIDGTGTGHGSKLASERSQSL